MAAESTLAETTLTDAAILARSRHHGDVRDRHEQALPACLQHPMDARLGCKQSPPGMIMAYRRIRMPAPRRSGFVRGVAPRAPGSV